MGLIITAIIISICCLLSSIGAGVGTYFWVTSTQEPEPESFRNIKYDKYNRFARHNRH